MELIDNSQHIK